MSGADDGGGCIFCDALAGAGDNVLHRADKTFVVLNAYPYNTGHVMVAPLRHVGELRDLDTEERDELMATTSRAVDVIAEAMKPHGFNVGMNLGSVAGAGVPGHLHVHVVPRWGGDTNFMPVVGKTKVLPEMLSDTRKKLAGRF